MAINTITKYESGHFSIEPQAQYAIVAINNVCHNIPLDDLKQMFLKIFPEYVSRYASCRMDRDPRGEF